MDFQLRIRRAERADAPEIARLSAELGYPASAPDVSERLAELLALATQFIAVAVGPHGLVGWIAAERRCLLQSGDKAELTGLVVGQTARRRGVGRALVTAAENWATDQRLDGMVVRSNIDRAESHRFYENMGFVRNKTQHVHAKVVDRQDGPPARCPAAGENNHGRQAAQGGPRTDHDHRGGRGNH